MFVSGHLSPPSPLRVRHAVTTSGGKEQILFLTKLLLTLLSLQSVLNSMCGYGTQNLRSWKAKSLIYTEGRLEKIVGWGQRNLLLVAGLAIGLFFLEVTEAVTALRLCLY